MNSTGSQTAAHRSIHSPIPFSSPQGFSQLNPRPSLRWEVTEIQKPELGRKYGKKDRRPLDPPAVVLLRVYRLYGDRTTGFVERELEDYKDFAGRDLICSIDLHRVQKHSETRSNAHTPTIRPHTPSQGRGKSPELGHDYAQPARPSTSLDRRTCTDLVVGSRVIQSSVIDLHGQKVLVFVFSDLAIQDEGQFYLSYRLFDITDNPSPGENGLYGSTISTCLASCTGGTFQVYPTKSFPGLPASTDLSKLLVRWGVKLNSRVTDRSNRRTLSIGSSGSGETPL